MKVLTEKTNPKLTLEADNEKNKLRVSLRVWGTKNNTEFIVRIENQNKKAEKKLWYDNEKQLNNGQVTERVLNFLQMMGIIQNPENWTSSANRTNEVQRMDEYEDADQCIYFVFYVHNYLIKF
ncbi:MAG: hypothetical protein NTX91_05670 [candidate division SR1 bacterium]|nr:hypothetical protein [candidate division SR1 bacterium]